MELDELFLELLPSLEELKEGFGAALPRLAAALCMVLVGWAVAWVLRAVVRRIFRRLGRRVPAGRPRTAYRDAVAGRGAGDVVARGVFWLVVLAALMVATEVLGLPVLTTWLTAIASYVPHVVLAAAIGFAGVVGGRLAEHAVEHAVATLAPRQARHLGRLTRIGITAAALLIAASQLGLDVSLLTAVFLIVLGTSLGGAALAFGLGARSTIANIVAMHQVNKAYRIGELIRVGDDQGRIVRTSATAVFVEGQEGELAIPGNAFAESRCLRLGREEAR